MAVSGVDKNSTDARRCCELRSTHCDELFRRDVADRYVGARRGTPSFTSLLAGRKQLVAAVGHRHRSLHLVPRDREFLDSGGSVRS